MDKKTSLSISCKWLLAMCLFSRSQLTTHVKPCSAFWSQWSHHGSGQTTNQWWRRKADLMMRSGWLRGTSSSPLPPTPGKAQPTKPCRVCRKKLGCVGIILPQHQSGWWPPPHLLSPGSGLLVFLSDGPACWSTHHLLTRRPCPQWLEGLTPRLPAPCGSSAAEPLSFGEDPVF